MRWKCYRRPDGPPFLSTGWPLLLSMLSPMMPTYVGLGTTNSILNGGIGVITPTFFTTLWAVPCAKISTSIVFHNDLIDHAIPLVSCCVFSHGDYRVR